MSSASAGPVANSPTSCSAPDVRSRGRRLRRDAGRPRSRHPRKRFTSRPYGSLGSAGLQVCHTAEVERMRLAAFLLAVVVALPAPPSLKDVMRRVGAYVDSYGDKASIVV